MSVLNIQKSSAIALGLVSHWGFFVHGERDLGAANIARFHLLGTSLLIFAKVRLESVPIQDALRGTVTLLSLYAGTLFFSILVFRLFWSPLNHIQGPLSLRLTKLTHVWKQARFRNCEVLHELHKQYGDIVRTGPNEVTLFGTEAYYKVHGKDSECGRAAYYDLLHPMVSLDTTRDPAVHAYRRKIWDQAFSMRALERLEPLVYEKADLLVQQLRNKSQSPVNISAWLEYYTFDLMGEFGLTIKFKNLERAGPHPILTIYHMAHRRLGPFAAAPWIKHLMMGIPYIERMKYYRQFMDWAATELQRNIKEVSEDRTDIIGYVLEDAKATGGVAENWNFVLGDFVLVLVAGSDPMRQVLSNMLYYLLCNPRHLQQIREELSSIHIRDYKALQQLPHLTACIYETLRLNPAVPSSGLRQSPPEGLVVADKFIPGEQRLRCRSTAYPEAFVPWSTGKYACLGKNLSLIEIRVAAALILTEFDFEFAPGEDGQRMFSEAIDYFTTSPGPLHLVFKDRVVK